MTFRALFFWVATLLVATLSGEAFAQTATPGKTIDRRDGRSKLALVSTSINREDCILDDTLGLHLTLANAANLSLKVWAGTSLDCGKATSRTSLGSQCWLVFSEETATTEVTLRVRDIVQATGDVNECNSDKTEGTLTLFFELADGDNPITTVAPVQLGITYDLTGPKAPDMADSLGVGETRLYPSWKLSTSNDVKHYRIYCEKTGLTGTTSDSLCESSTLKPGEPPLVELAERGETGEGATSGEASGLENYQQYACAVSAVDDMGNSGPLSELVCGEPEPVLGYFKGYRAAGGKAGGGYCSFGRSGAVTPAAALMFFAALGLFRRRSRPRGAAR